METKRFQSSLLDIGIPLLSLILGYILDIIDRSLRTNFAENFQVYPTYFFLAALPILVAIIFLMLAWYLFRKTLNKRRTAAAYIVFGVIGILIFASILVQIPGLDASFFMEIRALVGHIAFGSTYWISSILLVTGIAGILGKR